MSTVGNGPTPTAAGNTAPAVIEVTSTILSTAALQNNGIAVGPLTVASGVSYTIASGKRLVIL